MTNRTPIDAALRARGLIPLHPVCPCCGETCARDDYPTKDDYRIGAALITKYGAMPCRWCVEKHHECLHCEKAILDGEGDVRQADYGPVCGEWFCSAACEYDAIADLAT